MSYRIRLQQSGLFAARSLHQQAVPFGEYGAQHSPPGLQIAQPSFDGDELFGGQFANATAGYAAGIAFAEDASQIVYRKTDRQRTPYQLHASECFSWKNPVTGCRARRSGQKTATFVIAHRVWADACKACQFAGVQGPICGRIRSHGNRLRGGIGSRVKRDFMEPRWSGKRLSVGENAVSEGHGGSIARPAERPQVHFAALSASRDLRYTG